VDDFNARLSSAADDYMREHHVTQQQVADELGRSQNYVSGRLIGKHNISADIIMGIAIVAHIPPDQLMRELQERAARKAALGTDSPASPDPAGAAG
jgi:transcriptional regulator with XRE-family HTH domain